MRLPRNPIVKKLGNGAAALVVATALVVAATPAQADPAAPAAAKADLEFKVAGENVVYGASKPYYVQITNNGPDVAKNVRVTVDVSGLKTDLLTVVLPDRDGCTTDAGKSSCIVGDIRPGENVNTWSPFTVVAVDGESQEPLAAGSFTVEVSSDTAEADPNNNKPTTVGVKTFNRTFDMQAIVADVYSDLLSQKPIKPGEVVDFYVGLANLGSEKSPDVVAEISLPNFVTFADGNDECTFNAARTSAKCGTTGVPPLAESPGWTPSSMLRVKVAADAPGPVALKGGIVSAGAKMPGEAAPVSPARASVASRKRSLNLPRPADSDKTNDAAKFSVFTDKNPADLAVNGGSGSGTVGSTVTIPVTVTNKGPASSDATTQITAPTGTLITKTSSGCSIKSGGTSATCHGGFIKPGRSVTKQIDFKIVAATVGANGKAEVSGPLEDPDKTNNSAPITITVTSGGGGGGGGGALPITGTRTASIAGGGLTVLLAGLALYLVARRRRVLLVAPDKDA
jgi:LPXTG-motif cell wall-anchored protein